VVAQGEQGEERGDYSTDGASQLGPAPPPQAPPRCCYDNGAQAANLFALYLGAVPPEYVDATVGMLAAAIRNRTATVPQRSR
jgi:hypothetical protein